MKDPGKKKSKESLREKAVTRVKGQKKQPDLPSGRLNKLVHELEVPQVELEMQNEELILEKQRSQDLEDKFYRLDNFAPIGYFTLSKYGRILEANLYGSGILGKERSKLINCNLGFFFTMETRPAWDEYFQSLFIQETKRSCEVELVKENDRTAYMLLNGRVNEQGDQCMVTMIDITEGKLIHKKLLNTIAITEERERSYFSAEIHDTLGPLLSAAKLYLQMAQRSKSGESHEENIRKTEELIQNAFDIVVEISNKLSPPHLGHFGLRAAIRSFINKTKVSSDLEITFNCNIEERLSPEVEAIFYRIILECLTNTLKHGKARNVLISLELTGPLLELEYKDDGIGYAVEEALASGNGLGLISIRNQINTLEGELKLASKPGNGVDYRISAKVKRPLRQAID